MSELLESPWVLLAAAGTFVGSLVALPLLVAAIPRDYFATRDAPSHPWRRQRPFLYFLLRVLANVLGVLLLLAGIAMLVLPGQGILTILAGLVLTSFPGKRRLELFLVRQRAVAGTLNWMRERARRPPLELPPREP